MKKIFVAATPILLSSILLFTVSCRSVPREADVPLTLSAAELTQKAQDAYDGGRSEEAALYYRMVQKRFYDDLPTRLGAEFELAHIEVKRENWKAAMPLLETVLSYYEGIQAYTLPSAYYKLAQLDREKIPDSVREK